MPGELIEGVKVYKQYQMDIVFRTGNGDLAKQKSRPPEGIGAVNRDSLSEVVYQTLRRSILDHFSEAGLARQMKVSPTPVREALRRLAAEGLVVISPWKSAVVQEFADQQIIEIYQCREVLEGLACNLAAKNIDADGIEELNKTLNHALKEKHPLKLSRNKLGLPQHNLQIRTKLPYAESSWPIQRHYHAGHECLLMTAQSGVSRSMRNTRISSKQSRTVTVRGLKPR